MSALRRVARFPRLRALTWVDDTLYASREYELLRTRISPGQIPSDRQRWEAVSSFSPPSWRPCTSRTNLSSRLVRDDLHALAVLPSQAMVAAAPGARLTRRPHSTHSQVTH